MQVLKLNDLKRMRITDLSKMAHDLGIEDYQGLKKQDLIFSLLSGIADKRFEVHAEGVLELMSDGYGFLRSADSDYQPSPDDIYVSPSQMRRFNLRPGDTVSGPIRQPREGERFFGLQKVERVNYVDPLSEEARERILFDNLTPLYPTKKLKLEHDSSEMTTRIIDMFCPIGLGQRCLIVAPPKAGKTVLLQNIAHAISHNHPDIKLIVLLIDERPEEVTDMQRNVQRRGRGLHLRRAGHPPRAGGGDGDRQGQAPGGAEARRRASCSTRITRLARAYNTVVPASGKILSGGVDANALHKPKRFFGAARNIEEGGSLTIIGTALIDTGSRMDEVIFEEFKGTGNSEIVLDRKLMEKRIFPALDINKSGTRKEELLLPAQDLVRITALRQVLHPFTPIDAMEFVLKHMRPTSSEPGVPREHEPVAACRNPWSDACSCSPSPRPSPAAAPPSWTIPTPSARRRIRPRSASRTRTACRTAAAARAAAPCSPAPPPPATGCAARARAIPRPSTAAAGSPSAAVGPAPWRARWGRVARRTGRHVRDHAGSRRRERSRRTWSISGAGWTWRFRGRWTGP